MNRFEKMKVRIVSKVRGVSEAEAIRVLSEGGCNQGAAREDSSARREISNMDLRIARTHIEWSYDKVDLLTGEKIYDED